MNKNKFFEKFLEKLSQMDESKIKRYLESVENERRTYKLILDYLDEALIVFEKDQIIFLNHEAERLLITQNQKLPLTIDEAKKNLANKEIIDFIIVSLFDEDYKIEYLDNGIKGIRYYYIEKISSEENFIIFKIKDITENKNLEFRLKNLESISALNTLAAGIAHEIKNPLTAIDLHTQIIKKGIEKNIINVSDEIMNYIHIIDEEEKRLSKIVNSFLITTRKRDLKFTFEDINELLKDILKNIKPELEENSIDSIEDFSNTVPKLFIDKDYLRQAILNLFKNAIESMGLKNPNQPDENTLKILKIKTFYDIGTDSVGISIIDSGPGIDNDKLQKIFEPYYTTKEYGTGLGLTIVYKIVKEHGGEIKVESEKGKGSTFTIYLPLIKGQRMIAKN